MHIKFSQYKAVICSSYAILMNGYSDVPLFAYCNPQDFNSVKKNATSVCSGVMVFVTVYVIFIINAFQFGMDQLHDSPTEDSILFI